MPAAMFWAGFFANIANSTHFNLVIHISILASQVLMFRGEAMDGSDTAA
jgi:hypothetical protein